MLLIFVDHSWRSSSHKILLNIYPCYIVLLGLGPAFKVGVMLWMHILAGEKVASREGRDGRRSETGCSRALVHWVLPGDRRYLRDLRSGALFPCVSWRHLES